MPPPPDDNKKNDNNVAETNEDDEDEDDVLDVEVIPPGMVKDLRKTYSISVADGWKYLAKFNPGNTYMLCYLNCPVCSPDSKYSILVGNDNFIGRYAYGQEWYKYEFICGFIALVQHTCHTDIPPYRHPGIKVTMVRTPHPRAQVRESEVLDLDGKTHLVSVACARSHFAVLFYDIERHSVIVYDGLFMKLTTWQHHVMHTLKKYGLQRHDAQCNVVVKTKPPELELYFEDKDEPWVVYNDHTILQVDGYNCGPIACLKVMEIYGILPPNSVAEIAHQRYGYRASVMDQYQRFLSQHDRDIKLILNKSGFERFSRDCKNELSGGEDDDEPQVAPQVADNDTDDKPQVSDKEDDDDGEEEGEEAEDNSHTSNKRKLAMEKKNTKQQESAKKAMKQCGDAALKAGISPGAVVTLQVDYRTCYNPEGLVAIVYDVQPRTGGVRVCCQHGVITHDGSKGNYWVPADKYVVKALVGTFLPIPDDLAQVRKMVEDGEFMEKEHEMPRISYSKMHQLQIDANSPIKKSKGCGCKKGKCGKNCGCKKKNMSCHSGCSCNGNCDN